MTSRIIVNNIQSDAGVSTVFFNSDIGGTGGTLNVDGNLNVGGVVTYEDVTNVDSVGIVTARSGIHVTGGSVGIGTENPATKLNVVGNTRVEGFSNAKIQIKRTGNTVANGSIEFLGSDNSFGWGLIANYDAGGSNFNIKEGSDSRLYIKSGNIGINSTIPRSKLHVASGTSGYNTGNPTGLGAGAIASIESNGTVGLQFLSGNSHNNYIYFGDTNSATTGSIQYSHGANALIFNVNGGSERLRITSAGQVNINASSESFGGKVLIKNNVDYTTTDFDDNPTLYLLNGDQTTGISEAAIILAGRNTSGSTYRAAISGNGSSGIKFHPSNNAELDHTPAMLINNNNRIGINVTSPEDPLHVKNTSNAATSIRIQTGTSSTNNGDEYSSVIFDGNGYVGAKIASHRDDGTWNDRGDLRFYSGYGNNVFTQRMRITNTGGVTIGSGNNNSSMSEFGSNTGGLTIDDVGGTNTGIRLSHGNDDTYLVQSSNSNFYISQYGTGSMRFGVGSSGQERLRITSGGEFFFGANSSNTWASGIYLGDVTSSTTYIRVGHNATGANYSYLVFGHGSSQIGSVSQNSAGNQTLYNQTSDYRLKENIIHLDGAITRIKQLSPRRFNFIGDSDNTVDGFIAHEVATVVPQAVSGTHDEVDSDNNPVYQQIDQSKLIPVLTAALKEEIAKREALEARIAALEGS